MATLRGSGMERKKQYKRTIRRSKQARNLAQLESTTHATHETLYVASWRVVPLPPLTSIGLILT